MLRVAFGSWSFASLLGALGCSAAPATLASPPRASPPAILTNARVPAAPSRAVASAAATTGPPAPEPPEPPRLEAARGPMHTSVTALTPAATEAVFGCAHATDERLSPPLHLLEVTEPVRFWASTGPKFPASLVTQRALVSLTTSEQEPKTLACGETISVDLEPGRYWVRGQTRTTLKGDGDAPVGFAYRLSEPGDSRCPAALATRGIHDWNGEFPVEVSAERVNADPVIDVRVDYQLAYTSAATRLLVSEPYPACLRVVADGGVARARPGWSHGYRKYRWAFRPLHPVEGWGGRVITEYDAPYSPIDASYQGLRFLGCHEAFPDDSPSSDRERERLCNRWLRATDRMTWPHALVLRWLDAPPGERGRVPHTAALASPATSALLRTLDDEGARAELTGATACAPRPGAADFAFHLTLHGVHGDPAREAFVLVSRRSGTVDEVAGVFEQSPCAPEDVPGELEAFVERWRDQPWTAARLASGGSAGIATAHGRLQRAHRDERLEGADLSRCATSLTSPAAASWLYSARLVPPPPRSDLGSPLPSYFVWKRRGSTFVVTEATDVKPSHCE
ncbi:MAG: hypothetical protein K0R38_3235 [Polyangiaceae bacterium]|nr:hypothetical protein [Polyangiaceae bacterium]